MGPASSRDHSNVSIPPPLIFCILTAIAGALAYTVGPEFKRTALGLRIGIASIALAFAGYLALSAFVTLKREGTFIDPGKPTTRIVTRGAFRLSRNPMYLSLVIILLALAVLLLSIWFLLAALGLKILLNRVAIQPEEAYLQQKFGDYYSQYMAQVRRWL